jgi:hypothetical protein
MAAAIAKIAVPQLIHDALLMLKSAQPTRRAATGACSRQLASRA